MAYIGRLIDRSRKPEYTGENRCIPCTIVNIVIAIVLSAVVATVTVSFGLAIAGALGATILLASLVVIYLWGYLVPGTPTFTRRYFPDRLLRLFDKEPFGPDPPAAEPWTEPPDPGTVLQTAGAVTECSHEDDLCLTDDFRSRWEAEIDRIREAGAERDMLADVLDVDEGAVEFNEYGDAFDASVNGSPVGQWESRAALLADLAAVTLLRDRYDGWDDLRIQGQGNVLYGLRVFLEVCPGCGAPVTPDMETQRSCCREIDVIAIECDECGARLLERKLPD